MEKIGVVTVLFNSANVIKPFLECVISQQHTKFNLYIIDNNSQDNSIEILSNFSDPRIKLIRNNSNIGVAAANNIGIKNALKDNCSKVLLLNNDVEFLPNLFFDLIQSIELYNCSLVVPKIMFHPNKDIIWYAGGWFKKKNGFLPFHQGVNQKDIGQFNIAGAVDYAPTCCLLINKEVFEDVGYMDEKYFVYFDDTDFLFRVLSNKKHKLWYSPASVLFHKVGSLSNSFKINKVRGDFFLEQNIKNHIYFLRKIKSLYSYFFIVFLFLKNNLRYIFSASMKKDFATFLLVNKSYFQGFKL
ncbi:glycosyltransferase family 2 protein [Flavobacteriales bacterium]|jgi:GT2 family glycosyltransferase|nr:glycosyltransferase family 2 protein [Flavobacteriales bacterium]